MKTVVGAKILIMIHLILGKWGKCQFYLTLTENYHCQNLMVLMHIFNDLLLVNDNVIIIILSQFTSVYFKRTYFHNFKLNIYTVYAGM